MNIPSFFLVLRLRRSALAVVGMATLLLALSMHAQPVPNLGGKGIRGDAVKSAIDDSALLFASGRAEQAEAALARTNAAKSGTSAWHVETARRLYGMGLYFRGQHAESTAKGIAARALQQANLALTKSRSARNAADEARALQMAGMIQDRLLHDPASALSSYRDALRLNPQSVFAAGEVERLTVVLEEIARQEARK